MSYRDGLAGASGRGTKAAGESCTRSSAREPSRKSVSSLIVSSNKTFSAWGEIFGDPVAVAAMVDRLVHHAEVIVLRGDSYRLKGKAKEVIEPAKS